MLFRLTLACNHKPAEDIQPQDCTNPSIFIVTLQEASAIPVQTCPAHVYIHVEFLSKMSIVRLVEYQVTGNQRIFLQEFTKQFIDVIKPTDCRIKPKLFEHSELDIAERMNYTVLCKFFSLINMIS